jgi:hypothetical protein
LIRRRHAAARVRLAAEFGVSRNAVRGALDLIRCEGLVERVPGVGTVVATPKYPHGPDHLRGLAEVMGDHGDVTNEVRTSGVIAVPGPIAARFTVPTGSPVVYLADPAHAAAITKMAVSQTIGYTPRDMHDALYRAWPVAAGGPPSGVKMQMPGAPGPSIAPAVLGSAHAHSPVGQITATGG